MVPSCIIGFNVLASGLVAKNSTLGRATHPEARMLSPILHSESYINYYLIYDLWLTRCALMPKLAQKLSKTVIYSTLCV